MRRVWCTAKSRECFVQSLFQRLWRRALRGYPRLVGTQYRLKAEAGAERQPHGCGVSTVLVVG